MIINNYTIISYYYFTEIKCIFKYKNLLKKNLKNLDIKGIILLAPEGININISIVSYQKKYFLAALSKLFIFSSNNLKLSYNDSHIFRKIKIKIKKEILTTRIENQINPTKIVGRYIKPKDWDSFTNNPDVILIDTRNFYEVNAGTFKNSINPNASNFTELIKWLQSNILKKKYKNKKIAMFCTGGIRCEKATSYLKIKGHKEVYHLEGGILKYLEESKEKKKWKGECFVFDNRVTVNKNLKKGTHLMCFACRMPVSNKDKKSPYYIEGISCPYCYGKKTKIQISNYKIRNSYLESIKK